MKIVERKKDTVLYLLALFLLVFTWRWIQQMLFRLPYFVDEVVNVEAAVNFLKEGNYVATYLSNPFDPRISTGIASTWPAGMGWLLGKNLLTARLFTALWSMCLVMGVSYFALRCFSVSRAMGVFVSAVIWLFMQKMPYFYGYIYNLGELNAGLLVALGVILLRMGSSSGAGFAMGAGVWLGKFIYLPMTLAFFMANFLSSDRKTENRYTGLLKEVLFFFLPLLLWVSALVVHVGFSGLANWLGNFGSFIHKGNSGADSVPRTFSLFERLSDPSLEWVHYENLLKTKIILLLSFSAGAAIWVFVRAPRFTFRSWSALAILGLTLFYSTWYFFWHPFMYIRHLQPVLYLDAAYLFALIAPSLLQKLNGFYLKDLGQQSSAKLRAALAISILAVLISIMGIAQNLKLERTQAELTGADVLKCRDQIGSNSCYFR